MPNAVQIFAPPSMFILVSGSRSLLHPSPLFASLMFYKDGRTKFHAYAVLLYGCTVFVQFLTCVCGSAMPSLDSVWYAGLPLAQYTS